MSRLANTLLKAGRYIEEYVASLNFTHGVAIEALGVIKTVEECETFASKFLGKNKLPMDDLLAFKMHKLNILKPTLESVNSLIIAKGVKIAFEKSFLCKLNCFQTDIIEDYIKHNPKAIENILASYLENPQKNIMRYVL